MITRYQKRISGPLMDRIDIHMQAPRVEFQKLRDLNPARTEIVAGLGLALCALIISRHPTGRIPKPADQQT
jgi:hypothetical protein